MPQPLVVALGEVTVELIGTVRRVPEPGTRAPLTRVTVQPGGNAAIAATSAAMFGCRARLCGRMAGDFFGEFARTGLADLGIDTSLLRATDAQLSPFSFTALVEDSPTGTTYYTAGDIAEVGPRDVDVDAALLDASAVLVDGQHPAAQARVAEVARRRGILVVLDSAELREGLGELIALTDVLVCSERLAAELAPRGELQDSLVELQALGPRAVVITLGEAGAIALRDDQLVQQAAFEVDVADTAGAGQVFHGALAAAMVSGRSFPESVAFATAAASLSCRELGAWAGIPELDEVEALLRR